MYFACKIVFPKKDKEEPSGIVYFKNAYPVLSESEEIKIITAMMKYDLQTENTLKQVLTKLVNDNVIQEHKKELWLSEKHYKDFISIIQQNYTVMPVCSNDRLIKQSGAFLLPGLFSIKHNKNIEDIIIFKSKKSLRDEFDEQFYYIDGENKENILKELDLCNINEATLFPELEHHLNYIKSKSGVQSTDAPDFVKFEEEAEIENKEFLFIDSSDISREFDGIFLRFLSDHIKDEKILKIIYEAIKNNQSIDWYKREPILGKMRIDIKNGLISIMSRTDAESMAEKYVVDAVKIYKDIALAKNQQEAQC